MQAIQQRNTNLPLKISGPQKFTEEVSKALKSSVKKGDSWERYFSEVYHQDNIPVLLSSTVLRSFGCGQVDIAFYKNSLTLIEIKSSHSNLSYSQRYRLKQTQEFCTQVFNCDIELALIKKLPNDSSFLKLYI